MIPRGFYVYIAFRPDTCSPFYIGKGQGDRYRQSRKSPHYNNIVDKFGIENIPIVILREDLSEVEAFYLEEIVIRAIGIEQDGGPLVNSGYGGKGGPAGVKHSDEWRRVRSQRASDLWKDPNYRAVMLRPNRKRSGNKQPRSEYFKLTVSAKLKGNTHTLGFKHSDESISKMREIHKRKRWINNGEISLRIDVDSPLPEGWVYGRVITEAIIAGAAKARRFLVEKRVE